jgi:hypothetical protein
LKDTSFRAPILDILKNGVGGAMGCSDIYYFLRTRKQYVEVYYLTHIEEIGEILDAI